MTASDLRPSYVVAAHPRVSRVASRSPKSSLLSARPLEVEACRLLSSLGDVLHAQQRPPHSVAGIVGVGSGRQDTVQHAHTTHWTHTALGSPKNVFATSQRG